MKRFYSILCIVCAVLAVGCIPFRSVRFGVLFFAAFAVCSGAMWALLRVRDAGGRFSAAAKWMVRIGNGILVLWLASFLVVEGLIVAGSHTDTQAAQADCVFVLGGGIRGDQPSRSLRCRLAVALDVMNENPDVHVVLCGGQGTDEDCTEASVMYNWLTEHGADAERLRMETQSNNTVQNIKNAIAICQENGWDTSATAVISSEFHLFRVRRIMKSCGLTPCAIAAPTGRVDLHILYSVREYFSIIKSVVTGY